MSLRIKDIAKIAKVSPSTVSLVLNNKPGIGDETRQRVLNVIAEMGYNTNALSKPALKNKGSIRFIVYKKNKKVVSDTPFFSAVIEGIHQEARTSGYNLVISYVDQSTEKFNEELQHVCENPLNGILLLATEMSREDLAPFKQMGIPLLILDSYFEREDTDTVIIDNTSGVYQACQHLIDKGHQDIGYLKSSVSIQNFKQRHDGLVKAMADFELTLDKKQVYKLESTLDGAYQNMRNYLMGDPPLPSAFFADNDLIAAGAIKALKEKGFHVPEDISVLGFDDMPFCEMTDPPLTTIRVFKQRMGMLAVSRLIERIEKKVEEHIKIEVGTELIIRESVAQRLMD